MKTLLFWNWWSIEHQDNARIVQGRPRWRPEATYEDPTFDYLGFWPRVWKDKDAGCWRMLYFGSGIPLTLMGAESADGIHWQPMDRPDIRPQGEKYAPNHLFTVPSANGGPVNILPDAPDGKPFKFYCVQRGGPAADRARHDPNHAFHEIVTGEGVKPYLAENKIASSADGLNWSLETEHNWNLPSWHPDPCVCLCYLPQRREFVMTTRPGWGDRRIVTLRSPDALHWDHLELALQPDLCDPPGTQIYGLPMTPYGEGFVGFLWMAHFANSQRLERFNQLWGSIDCQLVYSWDGLHFQRQHREPFIALNEPGEFGAGVIYPTSLVETADELRIYSGATLDLHHQNTTSQFCRKGETPPSAVILHTLRKDGFTYLESQGHWASVITKPMILKQPELGLNVLAPHGDARCQLCDLFSKPLDGFTFDDCLPMSRVDSLRQPLRWKEKTLKEVTGKVVRLEIEFRHARIHALHGNFHFADALDVALTDDGKPIDSNFMDC